jgi:hypothetical protein
VAPPAKTTLFAGALNEGTEVIRERRRRRPRVAPPAKTTLFAGALNGGTEVICEKRRRRLFANEKWGIV